MANLSFDTQVHSKTRDHTCKSKSERSRNVRDMPRGRKFIWPFAYLTCRNISYMHKGSVPAQQQQLNGNDLRNNCKRLRLSVTCWCTDKTSSQFCLIRSSQPMETLVLPSTLSTAIPCCITTSTCPSHLLHALAFASVLPQTPHPAALVSFLFMGFSCANAALSSLMQPLLHTTTAVTCFATSPDAGTPCCPPDGSHV